MPRISGSAWFTQTYVDHEPLLKPAVGYDAKATAPQENYPNGYKDPIYDIAPDASLRLLRKAADGFNFYAGNPSAISDAPLNSELLACCIKRTNFVSFPSLEPLAVILSSRILPEIRVSTELVPELIRDLTVNAPEVSRTYALYRLRYQVLPHVTRPVRKLFRNAASDYYKSDGGAFAMIFAAIFGDHELAAEATLEVPIGDVKEYLLTMAQPSAKAVLEEFLRRGLKGPAERNMLAAFVQDWYAHFGASHLSVIAEAIHGASKDDLEGVTKLIYSLPVRRRNRA